MLYNWVTTQANLYRRLLSPIENVLQLFILLSLFLFPLTVASQLINRIINFQTAVKHLSNIKLNNRGYNVYWQPFRAPKFFFKIGTPIYSQRCNNNDNYGWLVVEKWQSLQKELNFCPCCRVKSISVSWHLIRVYIFIKSEENKTFNTKLPGSISALLSIHFIAYIKISLITYNLSWK